jgi:hypothetical protein
MDLPTLGRPIKTGLETLSFTDETPSAPSGGTNGMAKLLGQLNLPTLALIVLMGGGNLFVTQESAQLNHREIEKAIAEIHRIFLNQERREQAYEDIAETNRIVKELKLKQKGD